MGVALGIVAAGLVATASPSFAAVETIVAKPSHGPSGGTYDTVLTSTGTWSGSNYVQWSQAACNAKYQAQVPIASTAGAVTAGIVSAAAAGTGSTADLTVTVPSTLALPTDVTAPAGFYVCAYDGTTVGTSDLVANTAAASFKVDPLLTPNPTKGASGGGYSVELNSPNPAFTAFSPSTYTVQFQAITATTTVCAATPAGATAPSASGGALTGGAVIVPAANVQVPTSRQIKVQVPAALAQPTSPMLFTANFNVCVYAGGNILAETMSTAPFNLNGNVALSAQNGSTAGGNALTLTAASAIFTSGSTYAQLQDATAGGGHPNCDATYQSSGSPINLTAAQTRFISTSKIALTLPAPLAANTYNVCVYSATTGSTLVAQGFGTYTAGTVPAVVSVSPATGPAQGGTTITVTGANFDTTGAMTATVGGTPMTILTVASGTFTAQTPPHAAASGLPIAVSVNGQTFETKNLFTYTNGITVTPNTAPNSKPAGTDLDIQGVGFQDLTFAATGVYDANSTKAHVYLVKGAYNPVGSGTTKTNGQTAECADVLVVTDTNLICTVYLMGNGPLPSTVARSMTGCAGTSGQSVLTIGAACTFSSTDVGLTISGTGFAAATTITAVNASTGVPTLSKALTANITGAGVINVYSLTAGKTLTDAAGANNSKTLTTTTAMFASTDVGKAVYGANVPAGTVISAFTDTKTVTLSNALSSAQTASASAAQPIFVYGTGPVPNGTYTVTVVSSGAVNAATVSTSNPNAANYMQSIISSGSTFTVADYN
ncbi:IPT/TIG domain-containing protein [Dactylosporangium sp. CS-033363]|uniref:IPT/TIG domain-containing protein n=1 Tax=Dactylosporangium sp. CS-033363 TaxID=3239935 RepID=UPI003D941778